jgi:aryl-alcohol dehydrogenase-like predicted oxidoreductase
MKLALGTVQLGLPYGIANQSGMPDYAEARDILTTAHNCGYEWVDTAAAYGQTESLLGRLIPQVWPTSPPQIATKIVLDHDVDPKAQLAESLKKLARPSVEAVMLHQETDIDHARFADFAALPNTGMVEIVGISCYTPEIALRGLEAGLQCLQVPCNLFDTGSIDAGVFEKAQKHGVLVFVRSIFLQGLFFLSHDDELIQSIPGAVEALRFLHDFCHRHAITPAQLALGFGARLTDAVIVLGAETAAQVQANAALAKESMKHLDVVEKWLRERPIIPKPVFTPATWPAP